VHHSVDGKSWVLRVLRNDATERRNVFERSSHEKSVSDTPPVIREHSHGGFASRHSTDVGEL
jgi:hypothetical protein